MGIVRTFCLEDRGQDLIEYSLLIAFIAMACLVFTGGWRPAMSTIVNANVRRLHEGEVAAGGG